MSAKTEAVKAASGRVEVEAGPRLTVLVEWWASGRAGEALLVDNLRRNSPHSAIAVCTKPASRAVNEHSTI